MDLPITAGTPSRSLSVDLAMSGAAAALALNALLLKAALPGWDPLLFNGLRFALAATLLMAGLIAATPDWRLRARDLPAVALLGLVGNGLGPWLFLESIQRTSAANTTLLVGLSPLAVALWGAALRVDRVDSGLLAGAAAAAGGVLLVLAGGGAGLSFRPQTAAGDLLGLASMLSWSAYSVYLRPVQQRVGSPVRLHAWALSFGAVASGLVALPALFAGGLPTVRPVSWAGLLYSGAIALVLCNLTFNWAVGRVGPARTAIYSNLTPIVAGLLAGPLLNERWTGLQWAGALVTVGAVTIVRLRRR